jgi:hypothetical protein
MCIPDLKMKLFHDFNIQNNDFDIDNNLKIIRKNNNYIDIIKKYSFYTKELFKIYFKNKLFNYELKYL